MAIPELRQRIFFTIAIFFVYRVGGHIPVPGVNAGVLSAWFNQNAQGGLFGFIDMFAAGNLRKATIFALGIMPYISASIIIQLLTAVVPALEKLQKEGEAGRKRITQYTRYGTIGLSLLQSFGIQIWLKSLVFNGVPVVEPSMGWLFTPLTMITMTAGTAFIMWLGEQISERGIGNGMSLIIFIGIIARIPADVTLTMEKVGAGDTNLVNIAVTLLVMVVVVAGVVLIQQGQRKIRVQYAKRIVGRKIYGGQSTHIPLRVNTAGVIPIIFAISLLLFPQFIAQFLGMFSADLATRANEFVANVFNNQILYSVLYFLLVGMFTYFYTAITFNPEEISKNLRQSGGFLPGIRPGDQTTHILQHIVHRITLFGAIFLGFVAVLPNVTQVLTGIQTFTIGGAALLIVVAVALDVMKQLQSQLSVREYERI